MTHPQRGEGAGVLPAVGLLDDRSPVERVEGHGLQRRGIEQVAVLEVAGPDGPYDPLRLASASLTASSPSEGRTSSQVRHSSTRPVPSGPVGPTGSGACRQRPRSLGETTNRYGASIAVSSVAGWLRAHPCRSRDLAAVGPGVAFGLTRRARVCTASRTPARVNAMRVSSARRTRAATARRPGAA